MEEKINQFVNEYDYIEGRLLGYQGGYPIIALKLKENSVILNIKQKQIDKIVRNAEIVEGRNLGVGLNFRRTAYGYVQGNILVVSGYVTIIERILLDLNNIH